MKTTSDDESRNWRQLSEVEQQMLETFEQQITELAAQAAEGQADVDLKLAQLLEGVPDSARTEMMKRFRQIADELLVEKEGREPELNPQQETLQRIEKERDQAILALWLSEKTKEKLRRIFMTNPRIIEQLMDIGEKLRREGVFVTMEKQQKAGELTAQQLAQNFQKEKEQKGR